MIDAPRKNLVKQKPIQALKKQLLLNLGTPIQIDPKITTAAGIDMRALLVTELGSYYQGSRDLLKKILDIDPLYAPKAVNYYSLLTDKLIISTVENVINLIHPISNPTNSEKICVLAVGGFGREQMAPFSDIDLLFISPYKQTAWGESVIESILYILWDLKLKIGYSVRTIDDCIRLAKQDFTIRTSLLEHRYLVGYQPLQSLLQKRLWKELFQKTIGEFIEAKLGERSSRHRRHGGARYMLEPNVKEGKGGLRDLQTLYWITKYLYKTSSAQELIKSNVFTETELSIFKNAENFSL